jgi:hypothetical protein
MTASAHAPSDALETLIACTQALSRNNSQAPATTNPHIQTHPLRQTLARCDACPVCCLKEASTGHSRFPVRRARRVPLDQGENLDACQGSPQDPPRHLPTLHSQPRHLDKTAKPTVSRYIPCLHELAHGQSSPKRTLCP